MQKLTRPTRKNQVKRAWHLIDVKGKILGRASTEIAQKLRGKHKSYFRPYLDGGDYVVVINAHKVKVSGKKEAKKIYYRHSGYPGGLKEETLEKLRQRRPTEIIRRSVYGMLPKNKLRSKMITRLKIYEDDKHPYGDRFKSQYANTQS